MSAGDALRSVIPHGAAAFAGPRLQGIAAGSLGRLRATVGTVETDEHVRCLRYHVDMSRKSMVLANRARIREIAEDCNAESVALFGSTARGEDTETSDCDFVADFEPRTNLLHVARMQLQLEELLDCPVDVVSRRSVPADAAHVLAEPIPL